MEGERKPQAEPEDEVEMTDELSEEQLDEVTGGAENIQVTSLSNVLKTRHDTAKNSISNVR
jgi:hypothetical protein